MSATPEIGSTAATASGPRARRPLRVAFCIDNLNVGGTELNALRTARQLVARGVELSVFSLGAPGPLLERYQELGVPVRFLPLGSVFSRSAVRQGLGLASIIRREQIQVVHAHDSYSNIFAAPWAKAGGAAFIASRRWWKGSRRRARRWANRLSYSLADRVLANSPAVAELLVVQERVPRRRIVVVPNFLDEEAFAPPPPGWCESFARELGIPAEALVVGVVASLQPIKDHATLLRAVAELAPAFPSLHVVLVGRDAGSLGELRALAQDLGISDRARFAGLRPPQPSAHHVFDVSVLSSVSEGLPNSILEAMAAGRPVVATAVGAVPDAVVEGVTGLTVPAGAHRELAEALAALLRDRDRREAFGLAGKLRARTQYAADNAINALLAAYSAVRAA